MNEILNVKRIHRNGSPEVKVGIRDKFFILGRDENDYLRLVDEKGESIAIEAELQLKDGSHVEDHIGQGGDDLVSPDNTVNGHNLRSDITLSFEDLEWDSNIDENMISDVIPISRGGTGADNAADALRNLTLKNGDPTDARHAIHALSTAEVQEKLDNYSPSGLLAIENGGTGAGTAVEAWENLTDFEMSSIQFTMPTTGDQYTQRWSSVCWGKDKFVAVCGYGTASRYGAYSLNGINWVVMDMTTARNWYDVCYGNNKFVAVNTESSYIAYSTDGITWVHVSFTSSHSQYYDICYGNGKFVAVASAAIIYSVDAVTWTSVNLRINDQWQSDNWAVCYGNGRFVTIARNQTYGFYSDDGIIWTKYNTLPSNYDWRDICYGNGVFVAVATVVQYGAYSTDGINWKKMTIRENQTSGYHRVCFGNGIFLANSEGNGVDYSSDGINWKQGDPSIFGGRNNCFGNNAFITLRYGYSDGYYISVFGTAGARSTLNAASTSELMELVKNKKFTLDTFQEAINGLAPEYETVVGIGQNKTYTGTCYGNGMFIKILSSSANSYWPNYAIYSYDGIHWYTTSLTAAYSWNIIAYGNGMFVAFAGIEHFAYSYNGRLWTESTTVPTGIRLSSLAFGNGKFIGVTSTGYGYYSIDGLTWTQFVINANINQVLNLTFCNNTFILGAWDGNNEHAYVNYYSSDGINWIRINCASKSIDMISYGNDFYLVRSYQDNAFKFTKGNNISDFDNFEVLGTCKYCTSLGYINGHFLQIYDYKYLQYSTDGKTWITPENKLASNNNWNGITVGDDKFIISGRNLNSGACYSVVFLSGPSLARKLLNTVSKSEIYGMVAAKKWS